MYQFPAFLEHLLRPLWKVFFSSHQPNSLLLSSIILLIATNSFSIHLVATQEKNPSNMVHKKGPDIIAVSRVEPNKNMFSNQKSQSQQDGKRKVASELKRKLKKVRSVKRISELDYLDAHLGHQHVQQRKPASRQKPALIKAKDGVLPNYMKPTSCSDARKEQLLQVSAQIPASGTRPRNSKNPNSTKPSFSPKVFARKSSLKLQRSLKKKSFPVIKASRATCSSTIKDFKFPKELELSPGATESKGTSAMRVCPYTYCSLNGHRHESLPPLTYFLAARRRSIKTQKSIKLKRAPSFRKKAQAKGDDKIAAVEDNRYSPPDVEDDDFFVEVFADGPNPFDEASSLKLDGDTEIVTIDAEIQEVVMEFVEWYNQLEQEPDLPKDSNTSGNLSCETKDVDVLVCELNGFDNKNDTQSLTMELFREEYQEYSEKKHLTNDFSENEDTYAESYSHSYDVSDEPSSELPESESSDEEDGKKNNNGCDTSSESCEKDLCKAETEDCEEYAEVEKDVNEELSDRKCECTGLEVADDTAKKSELEDGKPESENDGNESNSITDQIISQGLTETGESKICEVAKESPTENRQKPTDQTDAGNFESENSDEKPLEEASNTETKSNTDLEMHVEERIPTDPERVNKSAAFKGSKTIPSFTETDELKLKFNITRRRVDEDLERIKAFNPREPNFLSIEPDPDAETVDLRHQTVDDRKTAEEWMIDFALQRAVNKLAPARKRRVALLVEAFETVTPVPIYRAPVRHNSADFAHIRAIQACS